MLKILFKLTKMSVFGLNRSTKKLSKFLKYDCDTCSPLLLHHVDTAYEISDQLEQFWLSNKLFKSPNVTFGPVRRWFPSQPSTYGVEGYIRTFEIATTLPEVTLFG